MATYTNIVSVNKNKEAYLSMLFDVSADDDLTLSADLQDWCIVGVIMPAAWTAADITIEGSHDDTTFNTITSQTGTTYTLTVSASKYVHLNISDTFNFPRYIKLASSTGQASDRTVILELKRL